MPDTDITLWLDEHKMDALVRHLQDRDSSVEQIMYDRLMDLYAEVVPVEERQEIDKILAAEDEAARERWEALRKFRVFHITENGSETYLCAEGDEDMLSTAVTLRAYVKNFPNRPGLQKLIPRSSPISQEEFHAAAEETMKNNGRVVGAYDIDLDNGEFAPLTIIDGWMLFRISDVCSAAYAAMRKNYMNWDDRFNKFLNALDGKDLLDCDMVQELDSLGQTQC